ncbi:lipid A deacylase LpxR family protein [Rhodobacteraceae bacterium ASV31]|nr:lipid A deacylase LpxR family protein [Anianabacter salinae]
MLATTAHGFDGKQTLGTGRQFNNDTIGDGRDRWQTGSYVVSVVRGPEWSGALPDRMGEIVEYRFRAALAAPESLTNPRPGDRRYAATLSLGAHTHFQSGGFEHSAGIDIVGIGPMTGVPGIQTLIHDLFNGPSPTAAQALQLGNSLNPTATFEIGRPIALGERVRMRPFVETIAGVEVLARAGVDFEIGRLGLGDMMLRDVVTGQRYPGVRSPATGFGLTLGADFAAVSSSAYFPASLGYTIADTRTRLRLGLRTQGKRFGTFYGLTYLSPEFQGQRSGQLIGSLRVNAKF